MTTLAKNRSLAKEYTELKAMIKPLEDKAKSIKTYFDTLTNKEDLDLGTWLIHYVPKTTTKEEFNIDLFKEEHPEIDLTPYTTTKTSVTKALYIKPTNGGM